MNRIKELREELGMTQVRLSIELEVSQETISAYEHGKHFPSVASLIKLTNIFNVGIDYILGLTDVRHPIQKINDREQVVLEMFKNLPDNKKELVITYLKGLSQK